MVQKQRFNINLSKLFYSFWGVFILTTLNSSPVLAQNLSTISETAITSIEDLPGLITGISYLIGIAFAVYGIIKTKEHVENPNQTAMRYPIISFLIGGSMFALPIFYESVFALINSGAPITDFDGGDGNAVTNVGNVAGGLTGGIGPITIPVQAFANILHNITTSLESTPGLVTGIAYLLGLLLGVAGLLKIKEHVEEPSRAALKDGIVRLVVAGMLLAVPTMYTAMLNTIEADTGLLTTILGAFRIAYMGGTAGGLTAEAGGLGCGGDIISNIAAGGGMGLGGVICTLFGSTSPTASFLTAIAYLFGLIVGVWGILKIKDHVENPSQTTIWDPVAKLATAGGFFALPYVTNVAYNTVADKIAPHSNALNGQVRVAGGPAGLDSMIAALVNDTFMPMSVIINWFGIVAGFILVFIGISRLMKSAQEGARGPGGIGTIMTFITGGALLAFGPIITSVSTSLFAVDGISTPNVGKLQYTAGMDADAIARAESIIDSVILFVMMIGFVSVARGIFIMRGVAEGNSQASSMAGVTHLIGGGLAVNLAPFLNATQNTLGIPALNLGIAFGG